MRDLDKTKSFENFRPDEFTFREDEERKYIDPKSLQVLGEIFTLHLFFSKG